MQRNVGVLTASSGDSLSISRADGGLMMRSSAMGDEYFLAETDTVFGNIDSWLGLRFELSENNQPTGLVVTSRSRDVTLADRVG